MDPVHTMTNYDPEWTGRAPLPWKVTDEDIRRASRNIEAYRPPFLRRIAERLTEPWTVIWSIVALVFVATGFFFLLAVW